MGVQEIRAKLSLDDAEFGKKLSDNEKNLLKFSAAALGAGAALSAIAVSAANYSEKMLQLSKAASTSVSSFSALSVSAKKAGVSNEELSATLAKIGVRTPEMAKKFHAFGISLTDAGGKAKSNEKLFSQFADAVSQYGDAGSKAAAASYVLGDAGAKLVPMLADGAKGIEDAAKSAAKLGLIISDEAAEAAKKFNGNLDNMAGALQGVTNAVGNSVIEFVNQNGILESITDTITAATEWWNRLDSTTRRYIIGAVAVAAAVAGVILVLAGIVAIAPAVGAAFTIMFGPVGLVIAAIAGVVAGVVMLAGVLRDDGTKEAGKNATAAIKMADGWNDATGKLYELSKKAKLSSADLQDLAKIKNQIAIRAREAGEAIDVETMSIKQLTEAADKYRKISIQQAIASQTQLMTALYKATQEQTSNVQREYLLAKGFIDAAAVDASVKNSENYKRAVGDYEKAKSALDDVKSRAAKAGLEFYELNKQLRQTPEQLKKISGKQFIPPTDKIAMQFSSPIIAAFRDVGLAQKKFNGESALKLKDYEDETTDMQKKSTSALAQTAIGYAKLTESIVNSIGPAVNAISMVTDVMAKSTRYAAKVAARDLDVMSIRAQRAYDEQKAALEAQQAKEVENIKATYDAKIAAVTNGEASITAAIELARNQRLLADDAEYQAAVEKLRLQYEAKLALIDQNSLDLEQRRLNDAVAEQSFQQQLAQLAADFAGKKDKTNKDFDTKTKAQQQASAEAAKKLEAEKNAALENAKLLSDAKLKALDEKKAADDKALEKQKLQVQYDAELQEFNQTKSIKSVQTTLSGIAAAAQAFAALALIPFIGPALGAAAAAVIIGATAASVAQINSQQPVKPAALIAAKGGTLMGETHNGPNGGIDIKAESGETILSRQLTNRLDGALSGGQVGGGQNIYFQPGAISLLELNQDIVRQLAQAVGDEIRRGGLALA